MRERERKREQKQSMPPPPGLPRAFHLLPDLNETGRSRGVAFLEFVDPAMTEVAVAGLSGLEVSTAPLSAFTARSCKARSCFHWLTHGPLAHRNS